jgi:hypothetical protein
LNKKRRIKKMMGTITLSPYANGLPRKTFAASQETLATGTPPPPSIGPPPLASLVGVGRGREPDLWLEFSNKM